MAIRVGSITTGGGGGGGIVEVDIAGNVDYNQVFDITNSPITPPSGTIVFDIKKQSRNLVWAGPTAGGQAVPTFRALVAADLPSTTANISGTLTPPKLPKATGANTIADSNMSDDGTTITANAPLESTQQTIMDSASGNGIKWLPWTSDTDYLAAYNKASTPGANNYLWVTGANDGVSIFNAGAIIRWSIGGSAIMFLTSVAAYLQTELVINTITADSINKLQVNGSTTTQGIANAYVFAVGNIIPDTLDYTIFVASSASNFTISLPVAGITDGKIFVIAASVTGANVITVNVVGGHNINGVASITFSPVIGKSMTFQFTNNGGSLEYWQIGL
jgi:hypothetical protein